MWILQQFHELGADNFAEIISGDLVDKTNSSAQFLLFDDSV